jgi:hypothetical protein
MRLWNSAKGHELPWFGVRAGMTITETRYNHSRKRLLVTVACRDWPDY